MGFAAGGFQALGISLISIGNMYVQSGGKFHGPRRMLQKYFTSNFDPLPSGIDPNGDNKFKYY